MAFSQHDKVQSKADSSLVGIIESLGPHHAGLQYYNVFWGGALGTRTVSELDVVAYSAAQNPLDSLVSGVFAGYEDFQRVITLQRLVRDQPLRNNIYAFNASRTQFFPYQFKPLLKFLESQRSRLLICDEVGLGKTIEAGLILLELRARQTLRTVLIVCPSNLRAKWRLELRQRFGEEFRILQSRDLQQFFSDYEQSPDRQTLNGIVSLETLRTPMIRSQLEELGIPFDVVIIDEAHHLRNFGTGQRTAAETLIQAAQAVVMLTATPVHLGLENLFSLLNLLDEEDFPDQESATERFRDNEFIVHAQRAVARIPPDLNAAENALARASNSRWLTRAPLISAARERLSVLRETQTPDRRDRAGLVELQRDLAGLNLLGHILTRTRKRDVQEHVATRRAQAMEIVFSQRERLFYDTVSELIRKENHRQSQGTTISQWRLNTPQRRMASSIRGMVEYYREEHVTDESDRALDVAEGDDEGVELRDLNEAELRAKLRTIVESWPDDAEDSKYSCLLSVLRGLVGSERVRKVLVFATFKHTIAYLQRRLRVDGIGVVTISGDTPVDERPAAITRFRDDDAIEVLLASRVGAEGLDFQFCSTLVNYDLPWNPMEVEQRIGRLDRIGQQAPSILVVNLWTKDSIEERILRRLYDRIGIFERSIGDIEVIVGEMSATLQQEMIRAPLSDAEAEQAVERIARVIEARRGELESLERSAAQFVGVDAFFDDEIAAIRARRRFVTGEQLHRFLADFLRNATPKTRLEYDFETNLGAIVPDEQLRAFMQRSGRAGEALSIVGSVGHPVQITFDAQTAYRHPGVDFLSVLHPLVAAIAEHYQAGVSAVAAHHIALQTDQLSEGFYFFFVYRVHVIAARAFNSLEAVILREDLSEALDAVGAEALLGEMVELGESPAAEVHVPDDQSRAAVKEAELVLVRRLAELRSVETAGNDAFINQRLASLRSYYEKGLGKKAELLRRGESAGRQERYLRMLRGQISRLEGEWQTKESQLERHRQVSTDYEPIVAGILEIVPAAAEGARPERVRGRGPQR